MIKEILNSFSLTSAIDHKVIVVGLLLLLIIFMEIQLVRMRILFMKITYVKYRFLDNFKHSINIWEIKCLPIISAFLKFPFVIIIGYFTPTLIAGVADHFYQIDILPYISLNFSPDDSILKLIIGGVFFLLALFVTEADSSTPLVRRLLENVRINMKEMISLRLDNEAKVSDLYKKVDILVSKFYNFLSLKQNLTLPEKIEKYYEEIMLHDIAYSQLRKLYYESGAGFIVGFLMNTTSSISIFIAIFPAYIVAFIVRSLTVGRIKELYVMYNDYAEDVCKSSGDIKSKLLDVSSD